jgi:hypothetical protein
MVVRNRLMKRNQVNVGSHSTHEKVRSWCDGRGVWIDCRIDLRRYYNSDWQCSWFNLQYVEQGLEPNSGSNCGNVNCFNYLLDTLNVE